MPGVDKQKSRGALLVQQLEKLKGKRREMLERNQQPRQGTADLRNYVEPCIKRIVSEIADIDAFLAQHQRRDEAH
jgi:hypothetical protein